MVGSLKILVYEHTAGGGLAGEELPDTILSEGYGMLRSLISDLSRAGHRTVSLIDSRLTNSSSSLLADRITSISSKAQLAKIFSKTLESVDAACVIAPEANGILEALVRKSEESGVVSLNCSADSVHRSSDKALAFAVLENAGLRVPETRIIDLRQNSEAAIKEGMSIGTPFILKPLRGVGCSGLSLVTTENEVKAALAKIKNSSGECFAVAQEHVQGTAASVSVICTSNGASPLTLNQQFVRLSAPSFESAYLGGLVPLEHELEDQALQAARRSTESFPGLRGYVGVDMVLTEHGPFIIEINPRLTTSYIGARRVLKPNLADAIVRGASEGALPQDVHTSGYALFYKVPSVWLSSEAFRQGSLQLEIISPPLQYSKRAGRSLVLVYTRTLAMAREAHSLLAEAERN